MDVPDTNEELRRRDESIIRRELAHDAEIAYSDEGWDSRVYIVNGGEAVFKFPRTPEITDQYQHEIAALRLLETVDTSVQTPKLRWEGPDRSYYGYEGIVGDPLGARMRVLDESAKQDVGMALGSFLKTLHGLELPDAPRHDLDDKVRKYREKFDMAKPALERAFTPSEQARLEEFFTGELPIELQRLGGEIRLCHGDLGPWNIIVTPTEEVGVIDFGDVAYEDPCVDFSGFGDNSILQAAFDAYGADSWLREKTILRLRALPILDIPFYLGKHDAAGLDACLTFVRRVLIDDNLIADTRFQRG